MLLADRRFGIGQFARQLVVKVFSGVPRLKV